MTLRSTWKPWSRLYFARLVSILTVNSVPNYPMTRFDLKHMFLRNKTGYLSRNVLTKTWADSRATGPNLINVGPCIFYVTILSIMAILEIPPWENGDQFIIHCSESRRRLYLIEFVLYFVAGCLLAVEVVEILSKAIPVLAGGPRVCVCGGGAEAGRGVRKGKAELPRNPPPPSPPPSASSQTINW